MRFLIFGLLFLTAVYLSESRTIVDYDETVKDDLKNQVDNLKKQAQDAIQKLMAEGKTALAGGIKALETHLVDLEAQLEKLNPTTEVGKVLLKGLETLVKAAEAKLEEEIKALSGTFYDATTDELKKQVDDLKAKAKETIDKLIAEGKVVVAGEVKKLETHLVDLESQLEKLNPQTEAGKALLKGLETLVKGAEAKLEEELKKLSGTFYDETVKDDLKNQIDNLKKQAGDAIQKLLGEGKTVLAEGIKKLETQLLDIEAQLEKLNPTTEIGKMLLKGLETLVKAAETKLEEEIKKLAGTFYDATQDDLKKQVDDLKKQAQDAIKKLEGEGKTLLAQGVKKLETQLIDLETQLEKLNPQTEVGKTLLKGLETLVKGAEAKLEEELKKLAGTFYDATQDDLKNQVDNLKKQAQDAIQKLLGEGKTALAGGIKALETHLVDLEAQLEKLNPTTEVGKALLKGLETLVKAAEAKLEEEIKALSGTFYDATTDELKKQVDDLKAKAKDAITKLIAQGKTVVAEEVRRLEGRLVDLEGQLEKLNPETEVGKALLKSVEALVKGAETKLEEELKKLSGGFYADSEIRAALLKEASDLYDQIDAGEKELEKTGKTALVAGLEKVIKFIDELTAKVKTLKPTTDLGRVIVQLVEKLAKAGQDLLKQDLKKAQGTFYDADKDALLKIVGDLIDQGKAAYEKLAKEDKPKLIDALEKTITLVKETDADLKTMMPTTTIGKAILASVEKMVKQIETVLEMDLKAVKGF